MPIHDQGYRRYLGTRAAVGRGWTVIAIAGIKSILAKRAFIGLMLFAWSGFVVRSVQIYVAANYPQAASILQVDAGMFRDFLEQQGVFVFFVTIWVGASLISADRRANALQLYLSKPLTALEYVAGKLAILFAFLILVTWVPAMGLLLVQTIFAGSFTFVWGNLFLLPAITLFALTQVLLASMSMLALSSMSKSSRFVGVMYAGLIFFTSALFNALRAITRTSMFAWLSPNAALDQLGDVIFRLDPRYDLPPALAGLTVIVLIAASALILRRNVRGVEVVT